MNEIWLSNTLGKEKQKFTPINPKEVKLYSCGPTVYNYAHIGNLRAYVFADTLKRTLKYNGFNVKHIMNVTDVGHLTSDADQGDDKMVKALKREGKEMNLENMRSIANFYFEAFKTDLEKLNIELPSAFPFASDHIKEDIEMIQTLLQKDFAYKTTDGIYFDTTKDTHYGRLGGIAEDNDHGRIESNTEKKNYRDFALWKFADGTGLGFVAPFGNGFPGWHIECSAMIEKYLGTPIDIHTGGIDHIPVHHNNEIAQTECATGHNLANFWMHNAHITIGEDKMAKSGDNFLTLETLSKNGVHTLAYRYWLLTARYSTRVDYSLDAIKSAQVAYEKLHAHFNSLSNGNGVVNTEYKERFIEAVNNDLDTPKALAIVWELVKDGELNQADRKATLTDFDKVLGLMLGSVIKENIEIPEDVQKLIEERKIARENKDWTKADELRNQIQSKGFEIKD
ncbi:MAG: cysteinyl-tRNA synthetase [Candidatus Taylorbacteria bacterium]|nr:cysteinyl-tRNA synthetase [Candidatus Taylorbacteria bacterium]